MQLDNREYLETFRELLFLDRENLIKLILQQQEEINNYKKILKDNCINE